MTFHRSFQPRRRAFLAAKAFVKRVNQSAVAAAVVVPALEMQRIHVDDFFRPIETPHRDSVQRVLEIDFPCVQ